MAGRSRSAEFPSTQSDTYSDSTSTSPSPSPSPSLSLPSDEPPPSTRRVGGRAHASAESFLSLPPGETPNLYPSLPSPSPHTHPHPHSHSHHHHNNRRAIRMPQNASPLLLIPDETDMSTGSEKSTTQQQPSPWAQPDLNKARAGGARGGGGGGGGEGESKVLAMVQNINNTAAGGSFTFSSRTAPSDTPSSTPLPPPKPASLVSNKPPPPSSAANAQTLPPPTRPAPRPPSSSAPTPPLVLTPSNSTPAPVSSSVSTPTSTSTKTSTAPAAPPTSATTSSATSSATTTASTSENTDTASTTSSGSGSGSARKFFNPLRRGNNPSTDLNTEYENYLAVARRENFNDIAPLNFLYQSGKDALGRPIIVMIGAHLPAKKIDLERVMLYAISVMDHVVESEYVMVYAHTNMSAENRPNFAWLRKMYTIFNRKYKKNLKQLYIVHPTVWVKMTFRLFKPFLSAKFWRKLMYIEQSAHIWNFFQKDQLQLPSYVLNHGAPPKKAEPIFGVSLDDIVKRPENNYPNNHPREIPMIVDDATKYLREKAMDVEGIFRVSGANSQLKELRKSYDSGEQVDMNEIEDPHIVAGLLKLYLRELPTPLLVDCHSALLNCHHIPTQDEQINYLKALIAGLPKVHQATARHLLSFCFDVTKHSSENRMTAVNLAITMGPNIVRNPHETIESSLQDTPAINSIVALMIQHAERIL